MSSTLLAFSFDLPTACLKDEALGQVYHAIQASFPTAKPTFGLGREGGLGILMDLDGTLTDHQLADTQARMLQAVQQVVPDCSLRHVSEA